jgi:hypothetical protein
MTRQQVLTLAGAVMLAIIAGMCAGCKNTPEVGDVCDPCPSEHSIKADSQGKWECQYTTPAGMTPELRWVKVSN